MAEELSFLDWADCSAEDQTFLRGVLSHGQASESVSFPWTPPPSTDGVTAKAGDKASGASECYQYAIPAYPNVYINNVTANVNVHHGPMPPQQQPREESPQQQAAPTQQHILAQQQQQQQPPQHQQQPPQFMPHQPGAPTPGYIVPFSNPQPPQPTAPTTIMDHYYKPHHLPNVVTIPPAVYPPHHLYHPGAPYVTLSMHPPHYQIPARPPVSFGSHVPLVHPPPVVPVTTHIPPMIPPAPTGIIIPPQAVPIPPQANEVPPMAQPVAVTPPVEEPAPAQEEDPESDKSAEVPQEEEVIEVVVEVPPVDPVEKVEEIVEEPKEEEEKADVAPVQKSWASLFKKDTPAPPAFDTGAVRKPMALIQPFTEIIAEEETKKEAENSDEYGVVLAKHLQSYTLNHKAKSIKPRGLSNRSNWCFVNAILQALIACPTFYNLIKSLPAAIKDYPSANVNILRSLYEFVSEFSPMDNFPKPHRRDKKKNDDLPIGATFEASSVFKMLLELSSDAFKVIEGRQEDAEEFLTFLLNGINDEMLGLYKLIDEDNAEEEAEQEDLAAEAEDWKEVGPKNKSCLTRRQNNISTPLAEMVQGQIRSCVQQAAGEPTATLQPFFSLQLDISGDIKNVSEALVSNFSSEVLEGYMCSKSKQEVEASRSLSLEELPPILVLHLKRFVYMSGGCQKLMKNIDFPIDLEILRENLSPHSKNKYQAKQRQYKLFAVVYHNGAEATKGHYVSDVYHTGLASWLRCDDSLVKSVTEATVLSPGTSNSVPYILFYRRGDTMVGLEKPAKA